MWRLSVLCCLAALASAAAAAAVAEHVFTLSADNFTNFAKTTDMLVAEFYAPWCGHCKTLAPEYEKAAEMLGAENVPVKLAKIDATLDENRPLAETYGIRGFPTLKIFRHGKTAAAAAKDYAGPRDAAGIVAYIERASGPASKELTSVEQVATLRAKDVALLGVFSGAKAKECVAFQAAAEQLRDDFDLGYTFDVALVEEVAAAPGLLLVKSYDEPVQKYEGAWAEDDIAAWAAQAARPLLVEMDQSPRNQKALEKIFADPKPKLLAIVPADASDAKELRAAVIEAGKSAENINVLWADPAKASQVMRYFGLEEGDLPAFAVHEQMTDSKFRKAHAKPADVAQFLAAYEAGELERFVKSEAPPAANDGPVKVVVATTFDEVVFGGKDVFIEFYAPWCGHCQSLAPTWEQLGKAFENDKNVVIAKMDATANDVPSPKIQVQGFPTLVFVDGASGEVRPYSGERTLEALSAFVKAGGQGPGAAFDEDEDEEGEEDFSEAEPPLEEDILDETIDRDEL